MTTVLKPLKNNIMFQFLDETAGAKGRFTDRRTPSGIILTTQGTNQNLPRWGKVAYVGPETQVAVGEYILVEALMWTPATEIEGAKLWKTDDTKVLMVTTDVEDTYRTSF